ncbi:hypothetical protein J9L56_004077 [Salmonella enterica]|nr:hypothetical protein [Salmonella enterica]
MDYIVKIATAFRTQGMQLYQTVIGRFGSIMPANRFPANTLRLQKPERWLKKVNK